MDGQTQHFYMILDTGMYIQHKNYESPLSPMDQVSQSFAEQFTHISNNFNTTLL